MKLFYYDHTPEEYQPAHFSDATYEEHQFFDTPPIKHNLGSCKSVSSITDTPLRLHHKYHCLMRIGLF